MAQPPAAFSGEALYLDTMVLVGFLHARSPWHPTCRRLFERSRNVCLFVNDFNASALAVYRRMGFRELADWASAFYPGPV